MTKSLFIDHLDYKYLCWQAIDTLPPSVPKLRPEPISGLSCELGFMGSVFNVELPQDDRQQQQQQPL